MSHCRDTVKGCHINVRAVNNTAKRYKQYKISILPNKSINNSIPLISTKNCGNTIPMFPNKNNGNTVLIGYQYYIVFLESIVISTRIVLFYRPK